MQANKKTTKVIVGHFLSLLVTFALTVKRSQKWFLVSAQTVWPDIDKEDEEHQKGNTEK